MTDVIRGIRSSNLRDLAREAKAQGWDVYLDGSGHVQVVHPTTGERVSLSATANGHSGRVLGNTRAKFKRAGLDLGPRRQRRRGRHNGSQETPSMAMFTPNDTPTPEAQAPVQPPEDQAPTDAGLRPANRRAGGAFALARPKAPEEIAGHRVMIGERVDGKWVAEMRDESMKSGRRQWMAGGHDVLVERVAGDLTDNPLPRRGRPMPDGRGARTDLADFVAERVPERVAAAAEVQGHVNGGTTTWRAVGLDSEDYPLAVALDTLERVVAPALVALEAAGKVDAAGLLRAELDMNPVEAELLRLWRAARGE